MNNWTSLVEKGDYVIVVSDNDSLYSVLAEVAKVTNKSIFTKTMKFSKYTKRQKSSVYRIEPFLAKHKKIK